ncbi:glycoside hydrolase family 30 protein [Actomonas aquatica]|uniref:Glycoside hydrolase family 30 protein n=1 Tax=Actomonas aquatica TaxID=2866162 RepID=A0ABZ1C5Z9_9BACT|nr:glycoside hydrolase family 30 protein [Opitutus sp. WL0086]WRQ87163.1 glycoside hydrolase family 30 protein [Opitutus sp. WL0086]
MTSPIGSLSHLVTAVSAAAALGATTASAASTWTAYETARDNDHRLTPIAAEAVGGEAARATLSFEPAEQFQTMVGFGGALTESSAWVLEQLPAERRAEVIRRYFDPAEGIGYTLARTHINSCDFSLNMWSLDDVAGDYDLHHFSLDPMRRWVLPLIHQARTAAGGDSLRLVASPWSPPYWMKTNYRMDDGGSLRGEYAPVWAEFFVKFVQAMQDEEGIPVWGLTVQNEPQAHQVWESCLYTPEQERDFVKNHLGPALVRAGMSDVKLMALDHNRDILEVHADASLGDPEAAQYLWGLGLHWYVSNDFEASSRVHAKYPDKPILFTEGCWEGGDAIGAWKHGEGYARQMMGDFRNWVVGFIDWNIVLDQRGGPNHVGNFCDAPVIVNTDTLEVSYGPSFYYIGHFSRFVKPGAVRIASTCGNENLDTIAFANPDGAVVVVVMNETDAPQRVALATLGTIEVPARGIRTYVQNR